MEVVLKDIWAVALPTIGKMEGFYDSKLYPTAATSQMIGGVFRFRLLQTRTWPSAPIPSATWRPQKICLSQSRSPTLRVSLSIANCTPTADVTPAKDSVAMLDTPYAMLE